MLSNVGRIKVFQRLIGNKTLRKAAATLTKKDQKKVFLILLIQVTLSFLDVIGVGLLGVVGALTVTGIESRKAGTRISEVLNFLNLQNVKFQLQVAVIGVTAVVILLSRTLISITFTRRMLFFFARRSARLSAELVSRLLSQNLLKVLEKSSQETLFALTYGVSSLMMGILANAVSLLADLSILSVLSVALIFVDPVMAVSTAALFSLVAYLMHRLLSVRAQRLGRLDSELNVAANAKIMEVLTSYRESVVRNRRFYYAEQINEIRMNLANTQAEMTFMPNISKYIVETTVIVGGIAVSALQFLTHNAAHAFATLAVFLAATSRLAPALLRLQQGSMYIRNSAGNASGTLALIDSLSTVKSPPLEDAIPDFKYEGFSSSVIMNEVTLTYPKRTHPAIQNVSVRIPAGSIVAFVGPSGAGKTTVIDTLLGVLSPDAGMVRISGVSPAEAIEKWPGAISYVPQDVFIADGTIRGNVALGYPLDIATDERVYEAVKAAQLEDVINELSEGIDTNVGERGTRLSGGQRQRLGIARALFTRPQLLVLDEATSALDGETELRISDAISALRGQTTVVLIAHRLSTVRKADIVFYMENGVIRSYGSFDEVRAQTPQFDAQARLLGL